MSETVVVNRWKRYGKDRLYVQRPDGSKYGYWDLLTDTGHPESSEDMSVLDEALASWRAGKTTNAPPPAPTPAPEPVPAPEPSWVAPGLGSGNPVAQHEQGALPRGWVRPEEVLGAAEVRKPKQVQRLARVVFDTEERAGLWPDEGEDKVAAQLAKVVRKDKRWLVAHTTRFDAPPVCFDHLVVGPGGVFLIGSRHLPHREVWVRGDTFMVDGTRFPYITELRATVDYARDAARRVCGFDLPVKGLLLVVNGHDLDVKETPVDVDVMGRMAVAEWLGKQASALGDGEQIAAFDVLTDPALWRTVG